MGYDNARKSFTCGNVQIIRKGLSGNDNDPIGIREIELPLERNSTIPWNSFFLAMYKD
jgi:hypothetical protein